MALGSALVESLPWGGYFFFCEDALKGASKFAQNISLFIATLALGLSVTNPISTILQVAFPNPAQPQSEERGRETLLPIDLPAELRIPGGKTSGGRDRALGFDATAPPLARSLLRTDGRSRSARPRRLEISRWRRHRPLLPPRPRPPPPPQRRPRPPRRRCCLS